MSFTGTLDKCKACDKTVYFVDLLTADGVTYHKTCFRCSHCKGTLVTRTPSKLSSMFSGTIDKCRACNKTVYPLEKVTMEGEPYHKSCFKCAHGGCPLTHSSYAALDGVLYCRHHFAQLFMEKGTYSHVLEAANQKKNVPASSEEQSEEQPSGVEGEAADHSQPEPPPPEDEQPKEKEEEEEKEKEEEVEEQSKTD
ncbi:hypothetical protein L1987_28603 [Smallanthus sonchifolius]|uniref:Uncharacterized protein n=1 Tax=Smallanthus sonchifolius TaxID=185202 RepID=A0ACB9HXG8_9ASTR|nr:hypothetical protein L1987_28603 [Smallanthus sonchifolius]